MPKRLITESDVVQAAKRGENFLPIDRDTLVTPAARDAALKYRIEFSIDASRRNVVPPSVESVSFHQPKDPRSSNASTVIALGADHGGFQLKEQLKNFLLDLGYTVADVGTNSEAPCDYPDFAFAVASMVASGRASKGIMLDGIGVASAIVANKVPGVRAVPCYSELVAQSSREHNDANMLTLGGKVLGTEAAKSIVKVWLETWFGGGRHQARVKKISDIEKRFMNR